MTRIASIVLATCVAALAAPPVAGQQTPLVLNGRVLAAENERVLPRARIVLTVDGRQVDSILADDRGRFTLPVVSGFSRTSSETTLSLAVTKSGYAVEHVTVSRTQMKDLTIRVGRGVAIVGRVSDPYGEGVVEMRVIAQRQDVREGDRSSPSARFETTTDDLGEYRLGGLPAGRYAVSVADTPGQTMLDLRAGDELRAIDFSVGVNERFSIPPREVQPVPSPVSQQKGTGRIAGRVLSSSGRPIAGARVTALRNGLTPRGKPTDAQGRFTIDQLPAGTYTLSASRMGYVMAYFGQQRASQAGKPVLVREDETVSGTDIVLPRGTAVTGTIVDEHGEPLQGVNVRAVQLRYTGGRTVLLGMGPRDRRTDDRGRYRLHGLLPGSYLIVASSEAPISSGRSRGYAPLFYPGTTQASEAMPITADLGREVPAIDLVWSETPVARVTGAVRTFDGTPFTGLVLLMASQRSGAVATEPQRATPADGSFVFTNVPPGDYVVQAMRARDQNRGFEFGAQFVTVVDGDPKPLTIAMSPGATLQGRIVHEPPGSPGPRAPLPVPVPADFDYGPAIGGGTFSFSQEPDGTFSLAGLFGPTRFTVTGAQEGWYLKSVTIGPLDITDIAHDFGITAQTIGGAEVVISNAGATVSGHVTDSSSAPVENYSVVVFSTDRSKWFERSRFLKLTRPLQDGSFEVASLPPGEYWVAAIDPAEGNDVSGDWLKPEALEQFSFRAQRVTLTERQRLITVLRLIRR